MNGPTLYPKINNLLRILLRDYQAVLGNELIAFYLHGSLALGDFDIEHSDIDYLVVTKGHLSTVGEDQLARIRLRFHGSGIPLAMRMDGLRTTESAIRRYQPGRVPLQNGPMVYSNELDAWGSQSVIDRYIVRNYGITLTGPSPTSLIDPISPDDLRQAVKATVNESWASYLDENSIWFCDPSFPFTVVVRLCRVLYTLERGETASKPASVRWAQEALEPRWQRLIRQIMQENWGNAEVDEVINLLRHVVERCQM